MGGTQTSTLPTNNPYIHGTTSATLSLMKNTGFQLMPIIPMLTQYHVAPMVGELFQGGYITIGKDMKSAEMIGAPAFGKVHSCYYNLKRIASDYAGQKNSLSKEQAAQHVKEFIAVSHRCAFSNLNLLMISAVRYQQLGGNLESLLTVEELELFSKRLDAAVQFYYFVACIEHHIFIDVEALYEFRKEYQLLGYYGVGDYIRHFFSFEKILDIICTTEIDIESIFKNPTSDNIKNLLEHFKISAGTKATVERYLAESDNFVASRDHYFFSSTKKFRQNKVKGEAIHGYFFNNLSNYSLADYLERTFKFNQSSISEFTLSLVADFHSFQHEVINYIEVLKQRSKECLLLLTLSNVPLYDCADPLIKNPFPVIFVSNSQSIEEFRQEYRSAKSLKLGQEIWQIATKTKEAQKRTRDYLQDNHIGPVEVVLFSDLEKDYQSLHNETYALAYAIAKQQGIEAKFSSFYRSLDELNENCQRFKITNEKLNATLSNLLSQVSESLLSDDHKNINFKIIHQIITLNKTQNYELYAMHRGVLGTLDTILTVLASLIVFYPITYLYQKHAGVSHTFFQTNTESKIDLLLQHTAELSSTAAQL